ncbi:Murein tetrapeptide carboxypeptidase [Serratia plymuthica]|uniref:S66 peptidase family protein n=1 Tax=Serratia plymuthica TaxID=82996 RepID=UPI00217C9D8D|nr:LD-carboxypeptidase [Serratia plymuthica]CAI1215193.1 Murein tetrapeptide carboxypeptidase [Serratia plymuthica]
MAKITVVAPANTMCNLDVSMIDFGIDNLSRLGHTVTIHEECFLNKNNISGTIEQRVSSINRAITDKSTDIIMVVFGGYNCNDLIDYIDFSSLYQKNKLLIGYSDTTVLLNAYYAATGGVSLHGPGFGSFCDPGLAIETINGFTDALTLGEKEKKLIQPERTASDLWFLKKGFGPREWKPHPKWKSLNKGEAIGVLIGGNIESFLNLVGTKYCPDFNEKIFLIESSFNTNPNQFRMWLSHLKACGIFEKISGLLVGNFTNCSAENINQELLSDLISEFVPEKIPTLINFSSSHADPILAVPIGGLIHMKLTDDRSEVYMSAPSIRQSN